MGGDRVLEVKWWEDVGGLSNEKTSGEKDRNVARIRVGTNVGTSRHYWAARDLKALKIF
jgi:hypothetical protein